MFREFVKKAAAFFGKAVPLDKRMILFASVPDFADSAKVVCDYLVRTGKAERYRIYWAVSDPGKYKGRTQGYGVIGLKNEFTLSGFKSLWIKMRAGYCFYTHSHPGIPGKKGQIRCWITHGMSFKNTGALLPDNTMHTHIVRLSHFHDRIVEGIYGQSHRPAALYGYPRNDILIKGAGSCREKFLTGPGEKLLLWLPTFRRMKNLFHGKRCDYAESDREEFRLLTEETFARAEPALERLGIKLVVKYHPSQDTSYVPVPERYPNIVVYTGERFDGTGVSLYELMACADGLIADFSSAYVDFLLCDRPIAFDISDLDAYQNGVGFAVEQPLSYMPGPVLRDAASLLDFLEGFAAGKDPCAEERRALREKLHDDTAGESTERLVRFFRL